MTLPQLINGLQAIKEAKIFEALSEIPETGSIIAQFSQLVEVEKKGIEAYDKMLEAVGEGAEIADGLEDA